MVPRVYSFVVLRNTLTVSFREMEKRENPFLIGLPSAENDEKPCAKE
jgi:hypothetical protein